ncbi:hypothetical protein RHMOL_Rhmol07G0218700 [Rhododendron molle]|uniref:Uncharacterized protein n=1 Tax=Rhododendron molle TaxID=49168 RepID=A0ACC0N5D6_RHOML|nr:hypothetical protein RHMOL_Rhmol07G0218700 [Rhododendron molle]
MSLSDRFSQPYVDGVDYFIEFASANSGEAVEIKCPCIDCRNFYKHKYDTVRAHLLVRGIMLSYTTWLLHGEIPEPDDQDESDDENNKDNDDVYGELLNDHYRGTYMDDDTSERNGVQNFEKLLEASQCGLYPGCKKSDTLLAFVIELLQVKMNDLRSQGSPEATEELWSLANGPGSIIGLYSGCISNGFRFHTRDREKRRMCQNSGLVVEGLHKGKTINFYGYLCKIWELRYSHGDTVILFECEWYNTGHKKRIYTDGHVTSIDITRLWYKDDPFVLPRNVRQVFYVNDTSKGKNWRVVELVRHRGVWDIPEQVESPNEPFQQDETTDSGIPIFIENDVGHYNRDDTDPEIILEAELMADHGDEEDEEDDTMAEYIDDEDNELSGQVDTNAYVDVDLEIDVDYDD